jgi:hypothetical protein
LGRQNFGAKSTDKEHAMVDQADAEDATVFLRKYLSKNLSDAQSSPAKLATMCADIKAWYGSYGQAPLLAEGGGGRAHDQETSRTAGFGRGPRALIAIDGSSKAKQFQQIGAPNASVSHVSKILRPREEAGKSNVSSKRADGGSFRVEGQGLLWYRQGCCGIGVASGTRPALLFGTHSPSPSPCPGLA